MKPLSAGAACFYSILRNPLTVAGIVSKPLGPGIPPINVLHTFQQAPRSSPGEGHTNPVAQTRDSSRRCLLPQEMPPASGPRHTPLLLFPNTLMGIQGRQLLAIPVQPALTSRTLPPGSSCPDSSSLRKVSRPWLASWLLSSPFNEFNSQTVFLKSSLRLTSVPARGAIFSLCP